MKEISLKDLKKAQHQASKDSIRITKAMGLSHHIVKNVYLYLVKPDGTEEKVKKVAFGTRKIKQKRIKIPNGNKTF